MLAAYGRQFHAVVPVQIGYSRGADGVVVAQRHQGINELKGKMLATSQFTEADFFIRYLAQEAGLSVNVLRDSTRRRDADGSTSSTPRMRSSPASCSCTTSSRRQNGLTGCVTWEPKTDEVIEGSGGKARCSSPTEPVRHRRRARA